MIQDYPIMMKSANCDRHEWRFNCNTEHHDGLSEHAVAIDCSAVANTVQLTPYMCGSRHHLRPFTGLPLSELLVAKSEDVHET